MNSNVSKTILYLLAIVFIVSILFYLLNTLFKGNDTDIVLTVPVGQKTTDVKEEIDLELLNSNKFINLKGGDSSSVDFKAGKRNPFKPYD